MLWELCDFATDLFSLDDYRARLSDALLALETLSTLVDGDCSRFIAIFLMTACDYCAMMSPMLSGSAFCV